MSDTSGNLCQFPSKVPALRNRDALNGYLKSELALKFDLCGRISSESGNTESQEFRLLLKNVSSDRLDISDFNPWASGELCPNFKECPADQMQSPVSVDTSTVVQDFEIFGQCKVRMTRIVSNVRLHREKPVSQFLGEWRSVYGIAVEFGFVDTYREFDFIAIGGNFDTFHIRRCLIDQAVQSCSELVKHLSQLKRDIVLGDAGKLCLGDGCCPVLVYLDSYGMSFRLNKSFPLRLNGFSVSHRPL